MSTQQQIYLNQMQKFNWKLIQVTHLMQLTGSQRLGLKLQIPACPPQLIDAETDMMATVQDLKS